MLQRALSILLCVCVVAACKPLPPRKADAPPRPTAGAAMETPLKAPVIHQPVVASGPPLKVGLLVPLSGRAADVGKALQDAAVLALFDKYAGMHDVSNVRRIELLPQNTKGTPEGALEAAAKVKAEGATLIIGPLFAGEAEALKGKTGLPVVSFTNDARAAGGDIFAFGFKPDEQAARAASYVFQQANISRMAMLVPQDAYGSRVAKAVETEASKTGATLTSIVRFSPASGILESDINTLLDGKSDPDFGALFLAAGGEQLTRAMPLLLSNNITPQRVRFVGTGLWDDIKLLKQNTLQDAIYASAEPDEYASFATRFRATYDYEPPRIASLAYDAVALATSLALSPAGFSEAALLSPNGYVGPANGVFRFLADRTTQRRLAVIEASGPAPHVVDPAPIGFN